MRSLSGSERRTVTTALIVLIPALLYVYAFRPWQSSVAGMRDQLAVESTALSRERSLLASQPGESRPGETESQISPSLLFGGHDNVVASAELASVITAAAHRSRVYLIQATTRPSSVTAEGVRQLRVEMRGESDLEGILTFLSAIETGPRLIRFDRLDITQTPGSDRDADGFETLSFAATLTGFAVDSGNTTPSGGAK